MSVKRQPLATGRTLVTITCAAFGALLVSACEGGPTKTAPGASRSAVTGAVKSTTNSAALAANVCVPTGAHDKHAAMGYACIVCHPCGGSLGFSNITFPGGDSTANGTIVPSGSATTCSVSCHSPLGAQPQFMAWNHGPLQCTDCHSNVAAVTANVRSSHFTGATSITSSSCTSCHDQSRHMSGQVKILNGDGTSTSGTCQGCHSGQGQMLGGNTPPLLVGWTDSVKGDPHGSRQGTCRYDNLDATGKSTWTVGGRPCPANQPTLAYNLRITPKWWLTNNVGPSWSWTCDVDTVDANGNKIGNTLTGQACPVDINKNSSCGNPGFPQYCYPTSLVARGFGGTLASGLKRGQDPLACEACHDAHSSTNSFLFAATVNGVTIPPGTIDRAGVGAEKLCNACHQGGADPVSGRHALCATCHRAGMIWVESDGTMEFDPSTPGVDPMPDGSPCFACHGHEGIQSNWVSPWLPAGVQHGQGTSQSQPMCGHCHGSPLPAGTFNYNLPVVAQGRYSYAPPNTPYYLALYPNQPNPPVWMAPTGTVLNVTSTSASIYWETDKWSTSYVEYGVVSAGKVVGNNSFNWLHGVDLTGLTPNTTYVFRIRSSDGYRNVTEPALQTFATLNPNAAVAPTLVHEPDQYNSGGSGNDPWVSWGASQPIQWNPETGPNGDTVQYRMELSTDSSFGSLAADTGWTSATSFPLSLSSPLATCTRWYWRVMVKDTVTSLQSPWSLDTYSVCVGDPYNDY